MAVRKHGTLVAAVASTVTVAASADKTFGAVTVDVKLVALDFVNRGIDDLFVTIDGSAPTVNGDDTYVVPPGQRRITLPVPVETVNVNIISVSATNYSVEGVLNA